MGIPLPEPLIWTHLLVVARATHVYLRLLGAAPPAVQPIITGMHQVSLGAHHMRTLSGAPFAPEPTPYSVGPPHYVKTFTEYLRAAGYYTTNNVKEDYNLKLQPQPGTNPVLRPIGVAAGIPINLFFRCLILL